MRQDGPAGDIALARALSEARRTATAVDPNDWGPLTAESGAAVGRRLYEELRARGAAPVGAKIGATDAAAQARLGLDEPFDAPLHSDVLAADGARLSLSEFVAPLVELEIGLRIAAGAPRPVACVEIADSRFSWAITAGHAHADYGCQGRMLFGEPRDGAPADSVVYAVARRDGDEVARGEGALAEAEARLPLVTGHLEQLPEGTPALVATGSLIPPVPLAEGRWEFDFGDLGTLALEARP